MHKSAKTVEMHRLSVSKQSIYLIENLFKISARRINTKSGVEDEIKILEEQPVQTKVSKFRTNCRLG